MYCYLVDSQLIGRYAKLLNQIELRLTDLGIKGPILKIDRLSNAGTIIPAYSKQGELNVIAVGEHEFFSRVVNQIPLKEKFTLGHIPMGGGNRKLSAALGIPHGLAACDTIAARRIRKFDVGSTNEGIFISCLEVFERYEIECDEQYRIGSGIAYACIKNLLSLLRDSGPNANPRDGRFPLIIETKTDSGWHKKKILSRFHLRKSCVLRPLSHPGEIALDGCVKRCERLQIMFIPQFLNIIVGKTAPLWPTT